MRPSLTRQKEHRFELVLEQTGSNQSATWAIQSPSGAILNTGNAVLENGTWIAHWTPTDQPVGSNYQMVWYIQAGQQTIERSQWFDIVDPLLERSESRQQRWTAISGQPCSLSLELPLRPHALSVSIVTEDNKTILRQDLGEMGDVESTNTTDSVVFVATIDTSVLIAQKSYVVIWSYCNFVGSPWQMQYQILSTLQPSDLILFNDIRLLVDKFQKKQGTYQAIDDGEIWVSVQKGADIINSFNPVTFWDYGTLTSIPIMTGNLVAASAWWLLNMQFMLEGVDLKWDFSGQATQLSYDRGSGIESELSRLWEFLQATIAESKRAMVRKTNGIGHVSTRPISFKAIWFQQKMGPGGIGGYNGLSQQNQALLLSIFSGGA